VDRLDFTELRSFWTHLHDRFFSRLNHDCRQTAYKFETSLLRLYLIHATRQGRQDEVKSFFQEMSTALSSKKEWKDWFGQFTLLHYFMCITLIQCYLLPKVLKPIQHSGYTLARSGTKHSIHHYEISLRLFLHIYVSFVTVARLGIKSLV